MYYDMERSKTRNQETYRGGRRRKHYKKNGNPKSTNRIVKFVLDAGFIIPMGRGYYMFVTWDMLEKCWLGMVGNGGVYNSEEFGKHYVKYPGCYVQTIHMIFRKAGLT